jgi:dTDP-4-dehydrorhamnose 3,5-epimerase-like enzyme
MNVLDSVHWVDLQPHADARGVLTAVEGAETIPFAIARVFYLTGVVADRAGHAHRDTQQFVIGLAGRFDVEVSDGRQTRVYPVRGSDRGLYLPPMVFVRLKAFSSDAVMLVLASTHYDPTRSIRSWEDFLRAVEPTPA